MKANAHLVATENSAKNLVYARITHPAIRKPENVSVLVAGLAKTVLNHVLKVTTVITAKKRVQFCFSATKYAIM